MRLALLCSIASWQLLDHPIDRATCMCFDASLAWPRDLLGQVCVGMELLSCVGVHRLPVTALAGPGWAVVVCQIAETEAVGRGLSSVARLACRPAGGAMRSSGEPDQR
jgi:hypothetical protein